MQALDTPEAKDIKNVETKIKNIAGEFGAGNIRTQLSEALHICH